MRGLVIELGERDLKVDYRSVWEFVHAEGLSHKKDVDRRRAGSCGHRPTAAQWVLYQDRINPARLVFIYET